MRIGRLLAGLLLAPLTVLVVLAVVVPTLVVGWYSLFDFQFFRPTGDLTLENYREVLTDPLYRRLATNTLLFAVPVAILASVAGFVVGYAMVFGTRRYRGFLLGLVLTALMASYLARIYAWRILLGENGVVNTLLESAGLIREPLSFLLYSRFAAILAEVNLFLPLAALTYFAALAGLPPSIREASRDLGAGSAETLRRIVLPLVGPTVLATTALVFFLASGDYITPVIVGGSAGQTVGVSIAAAFGTAADYGLGGALSLTVLAGFALAYVGLRRLMTAGRLLPQEAGQGVTQ
jgi:spermidine/putrescine transport system permease protein